ncbi:Protein kinase domain, partial [Rhizoctonia solani]
MKVDSLAPELLSDAERRWVGYQPYLLSKGYQLRPRYRPGWFPSWKLNSQDSTLSEDAWAAIAYRTLDAVRVTDQRLVMIKMITPSLETQEGRYELDILRRFSSTQLSNIEENHVVPILDDFKIPDIEGGDFYVMPLLTPYDRPPFQSLDEIYDFLRQVFEGLLFLHSYGVAHRDIASANIMMDARPLYYEQFHPLHPAFTLDGKHLARTRSRTEASVKYYFIDFGFSFLHQDGGLNLAQGKEAREPAPEQLAGSPYNPFVADVYQLGALIRRDLVPNAPALRFLIPLARAMTEKDPEKRVGLREAQRAMHHSFRSQGARRLRWPLIPRNAPLSQWLYLTSLGIYNEVVIIMQYVARLWRGSLILR